MTTRRHSSHQVSELRTGIAVVSICALLVAGCVMSAELFEAKAEMLSRAIQASRLDSPGRIIGTLRDVDGPITDADVYVQYFEDEKCARLFTKKDYNPYDAKEADKLKNELEKCSRDLTPTKPDEQGHYDFHDLKPGWYAVRFLWNIHEKPRDHVAYFERNGFVIGYYAQKDVQGKYDTMARGKPIFVSGKKDVVLGYDGSRR